MVSREEPWLRRGHAKTGGPITHFQIRLLTTLLQALPICRLALCRFSYPWSAKVLKQVILLT